MTGKDETNGRFLPGNRFWEARSSHGRKPKFESADQLADACRQYFEWVEANPLYEEKVFNGKDGIVRASVAKMRAMTVSGLCLFLDISFETWCEWKKSRPDLSEIIRAVEAAIYQQKFTGAAADLLNANIIARDLGLADRSQIGNPPGETFKTEVSARDLIADRIAGIAARRAKSDDTGGPDGNAG